MPGAGKSFPSTRSVHITNSFSGPYETICKNRLNSRQKVRFNEELPEGARGIFIGESGNFDLFVEETGMEGNVSLFLQIAGGIVHPICAKRILRGDRYTTDAVNIVVKY